MSTITFIVGILVLAPEFGILGLSISYLFSTIIGAVYLIPLKNKANS